MPLLVAAAHFLLARHASLWLHELAHAVAALLVGAKVTAVRVPLLGGNSFTSTAGVGGAEAFVRHAGWICSVYVAGFAARTLTLPCAVAALLVAAEAVVSDLFAIERYRSAPGTFYCGNFGIIVLDRAHAHRVPQLLRSMINVTMMRGAQCAGLVSYSTDRNDNSTAARSRVVNGKRTDLCEKLLSQRRTRAMLGASTRRAPDGGAPLVFQGHTRFATSSIVNLGGCHPHRWSPPSRRTEWRFVVGGGLRGGAAQRRGVCHAQRRPRLLHPQRRVLLGAQFLRPRNSARNSSETPPPPSQVDELQLLLPRLLHSPLPSAVDSVCLAGLVDLLRTKGLWYHSLRYGYVFGALKQAGPLLDAPLPSRAALESLAAILEREWVVLLAARGLLNGEPPRVARRAAAAAAPRARAAHGRRGHRRRRARPRAKAAAGDDEEALTASLLLELEGIVTPLVARRRRGSVCHRCGGGVFDVRHALAAFAANDLEAAAMELMRHAKGSFGLVISHALDATSGVVVAARGQTLSIAVYPQRGMVLFGSEAAATKAAMGMSAEARRADAAELDSPKSLRRDDDGCRAFAARASPRLTRRRPSATPQPTQTPDRAAELLSLQTAQRDGPERARRLAQLESYRIDLDEVRGEVVALRWDHHPTRSAAGGPRPMEALRAKWAIDEDDAAAAAAAATVGRGGSQLMSWVGAGGGRVGKLVAQSHVDGAAARWQTALEQRGSPPRRQPLVDLLPPRVKDDLSADLPICRPSSNGSPTTSTTRRARFQLDGTAWASPNHQNERLCARAAPTMAASTCSSPAARCRWVASSSPPTCPRLPEAEGVTLSANDLGAAGQGQDPAGGLRRQRHRTEPKLGGALISHSAAPSHAVLRVAAEGVHAPSLRGHIEWDSQVARVVRAGRSAHCYGAAAARASPPLPSHVYAHAPRRAVFGVGGGDPPVARSTAALPDVLFQAFSAGTPRSAARRGRGAGAGSNRQHLTAVEEARSTSAVERTLARGQWWAQHVLRSSLRPGRRAYHGDRHRRRDAALRRAAAASPPLIPTTVSAAGGLVGFVDGIIYLFLPWTTVLLRLVQRRPWLYRVAGRSLIGDVPWVAQSFEAFA